MITEGNPETKKILKRVYRKIGKFSRNTGDTSRSITATGRKIVSITEPEKLRIILTTEENSTMNKELVDLILQNKLSESNEILDSVLKQKVYDILEAKKLSVFNPDRPGDIIKGLKRSAAIKLVMAHGYTFKRHGAEHDIYYNPEHPEMEYKSVQIPRHDGELKVGVARKIQTALKTLVPVTTEETMDEELIEIMKQFSLYTS